MQQEDKVNSEPGKHKFFWGSKSRNFPKFKHNFSYPKWKILSRLPQIRHVKRTSETAQLLPSAELNTAHRNNTVSDPVSKTLPLQDDNLAEIDHAPDIDVSAAPQDLKKAKAPESGIDSSKYLHDFTDLDLYAEPEPDVDWTVPALSRAPRRLLSNLGNTSYISAPIHVLANLSVYKAVILHQADFKMTSGRRPEYLESLNDEDGNKHINFKKALVQNINLLSTTGPQLSLPVIYRIFKASIELNAAWKNEKNDSAGYTSFLMDTLNAAMDQSEPVPGADIVDRLDSGLHVIRSPYRPEEFLNHLHLVDVTNGKKLPSLKSHAEQHWNAHLASGYDSPLTQEACLQYVKIYQCSSPQCRSMKRQFKYTNQLQLEFPSFIDNNDDIFFENLLKRSFQNTYSPGSACENHNQYTPCETGKYSRSITRFTRVGRAFSVELNRNRPVAEVEAAAGMDEEKRRLRQIQLADEARRNPYRNRIIGYQHIRMDQWANGGAELKYKPGAHHASLQYEVLNHESLARCFEVVGIVAYNPDWHHYTAFVLIDCKWVYYDDLDARPVYRDPWTHWPEGFVETSLFYQDCLFNN